MNLLARDRVNDGRFNAEEGEGGRTRLRRRDTTKRCDDMGASLCLPVGLPMSV
jgi:hypothetical protein